MDMIKVGIIGAGGNIGSATLRYIDKESGYIAQKHGYRLVPAYVCDKNPASLDFLSGLKTVPRIAKDPSEIIENPDVDIVVEATGQDEIAREIILESFKNGKSVVTPNKLVVAKYMTEIFDEARKHRQSIGFEASVMASVPLINALRDTTDKTRSHLGIFNGTTNYILTQMYAGKEREEALAYAKKEGYAEPDPTADIEGWDTAYKNKILTALLHQTDVGNNPIMNELYREGIENVSRIDTVFAEEEFGLVVKLLGKCKLRDDGKLEIGTYPTLIPSNHQLAGVKDAFNAIYIDFENRGVHLYVGRGAGPDPTKVPIADDIIRVAKERMSGKPS